MSNKDRTAEAAPLTNGVSASAPAAVPRDARVRGGRCRICGCTADNACLVPSEGDWGQRLRPCWWADDSETLCDNPDCLNAVRLQAEARR